MTPEMRRILNESDARSHVESDLTDVFRREEPDTLPRQPIRANTDQEPIDDDEETSMATATHAEETDAPAKVEHAAHWAIMRELNEGEKIVMNGISYGFDMKAIDDHLIKARVAEAASTILWELFRKFELLDLGSEPKMRTALGKLHYQFREEEIEHGRGTVARVARDDDELDDTTDTPDTTGGSDDDEELSAGADGKADSTPKQPTEQNAMSQTDARTLAARISALSGKPRNLADSLIEGKTLQRIAKDYANEQAASSARSALFKALEFPGHGMSVEEKVAAMQAAAPFVTAEPGEGESQRPAKEKQARAKQNGNGDARSAIVPVVAASTPVDPTPKNGNGHDVSYGLPVVIDLTTLGHFTDADLQPTKFGIENAAERAAQFRKGREAGFEPAQFLLHPGLPAQIVFVKR